MKELSKIFSALSETSRIEIIKLLQVKNKMCVCELTEILGLSQPNVSHHLRVLKEAGLVTDEKDGLWVNYRLVGKEDDNVSKYAAGVIKFLSNVLDDDEYMALKIKKAGRIDRHKICARR